jgi:predicted nucleotide-binding protein
VIERFQGPEGQRVLREALMMQTVVMHDAETARQIVHVAELKEFQAGEVIIAQGNHDTYIDFIVAGSVRVLVNGERVAMRSHGTHVGEMAMIDPSAPRSATVQATESTVVARVLEGDFARIANAKPAVWRALAIDLGHRLRERNRLVRTKNAVPVVFIGSTVEALAIAQKLQQLMQHDAFETRIWTDDVFCPSHSTLEDLLTQIEQADLAVLVATPDDVVESRGSVSSAPRDNVVFELGLGMGALGRDRTLVVKIGKDGAKYPSDLLGITPIDFVDDTDPAHRAARLGPVATAIREAVARLGAR